MPKIWRAEITLEFEIEAENSTQARAYVRDLRLHKFFKKCKRIPAEVHYQKQVGRATIRRKL